MDKTLNSVSGYQVDLVMQHAFIHVTFINFDKLFLFSVIRVLTPNRVIFV